MREGINRIKTTKITFKKMAKQKYFAHKVMADGHTFDSKTEHLRYLQLKDMQRLGLIDNLELQKQFELIPKQMVKVEKKLKTKVKIVERVDERAVLYHCDFFYHDKLQNRWVVEEVKSKATAQVRDYPLRRKLVKLLMRKINTDMDLQAEKHEPYVFNEYVAK